jgi:hypothetical protein
MQPYVPSGIVPFRGGLVCLVGSVLVAVPAGLLYGLFINGVTVRYGHFVATLVFSLILGAAVIRLAYRGKVRSPLFVRLSWLATFAAGYYSYWVMSVWMQRGFGVGLAAFTPQELFRLGDHLFQNGDWALGKWTISGWLVIAVWVAEFVAIAWISYSLAKDAIHRPFCEHCERWTIATKGLSMFYGNEKEPAWDEFRRGDLTAIGRVPVLTSKVNYYVRLDANICPNCEHSNYVNLTAVKIEYDKDGENKTTIEAPFITNLGLNAGEMKQLEEMLDFSLMDVVGTGQRRSSSEQD